MRTLIASAAILSLFAPAAGVFAASAKGSSVKLSRSECSRIVKHQSSAEYKPGTDARGKKVKEADLPGGSPIKLPETISIDIGFDLDKKYGLGSGGKYTGESVIGKVTVKGDKVYWNDKPLDQRDQAAIAEACRQTYGTKK
ncbi:MAG: hypothetical protein FJX37_12875 [Alphaproteobacteria bacterium]|nr:hypothetical protein [Alphaproteobacteria bacterium]MBM3951052.1 hypothetical protein [Rhodospirillales bacterium]